MGKIKGIDIRKMGSGNAGGTNAFRTVGPMFALCVIIIDILKAIESDNKVVATPQRTHVWYNGWKENLDDFSKTSADLATLAILSLGDTKASYISLSNRLESHHSELIIDIDLALTAIDDYVRWIEKNKNKMIAKVGVGKEN